jgi:hypothetical protein
MKKQLVIQNALDKIDSDMLEIEILEDSVRINYTYPSLKLARAGGKRVGEYLSRAAKRPVSVQVFFRNSKGKISDFQYAYAAKDQYYNRGAQVKG